MSQQPQEAEIREMHERLDGIEQKIDQKEAPRYDPPFLARVWLFLVVLVILGIIAAAVGWIF
jgi:hypothetical protein